MPTFSKITIAILLYLLVMDIVVFVLFAVDKSRARRGGRRISEATLLLTALLGGSVGALFGMIVLRHKTRHAKFCILIPLFLLLRVSLLFYGFLRLPLFDEGVLP